MSLKRQYILIINFNKYEMKKKKKKKSIEKKTITNFINFNEN
jgi:hypothetical protein